MPHKYVPKEVIDRLKDQISRRDSEIARVRSISRKDKDSFEILLARLRELLESARHKKNTALDGLMEDGSPRILADGTRAQAQLFEAKIQERMALIFRGEEKAFEAVLEMIENPDSAVDIFVEERDQLRKQLEIYEKMEQRPTEE